MKQIAALLLTSAVTFLAAMHPLAAADAEPSRFEQAQQQAWGGHRDRARALCEEILAESPSHHDARTLMARTYAWDGNYVVAREQLQRVLEEKPDYIDAYRALADAEMWGDNDQRALVVIEGGLSLAPDDVELLFRRIQVLEQLDRVSEAYDRAVTLSEQHPDDDRLPKITRRLRIKTVRWWATIGYRYEEFEQLGEPWQEWSASVKHQQRWGSLFGRVRHARRFGGSGEQLELDAYPKLPRRQYMYLNVGYGEEPFPELRAGAELFKNFAEGWEGSVGARYLNFGSSDVVIYTGSVSKYVSNYWISLRPVITDKELGLSTSWALSVRRYLSGETWIGTSVGIGNKPAPGEAVGAGTPGSIQLFSNSISLSGQFRINDFWRLSSDIGYREKEISGTQSRSNVSGSVSVTRAF